MGTGNKYFPHNTDGEENAGGTIRDWVMEAKTADDTYLFHSVEPGRRGQCYFLHEKERLEETKKWLDGFFDGLLQNYSADKCKKSWGARSTL